MNPLCQCGCGHRVKSSSAKYLRGHHLKKWNSEPDFQQKQKDGLKKKYGVTHPMHSKEIKKNYRETCLKNLGVPNPNMSPTITDKKKKTNMERWGVENPSQSNTVKIKKRQTNLKHHGVQYPLQNISIQEKSRKTCLARYGVETSFESEEVRKNYKRNFLKKYGVEHPFQLDIIKHENKEKSQKTCFKKYGVSNWAKTNQGRKFHRLKAIQSVEDQKLNGEPLMPRIGSFERLCLDKLQQHITFQIIRNPPMMGYFPDGYIKELKLVIEFDERFHFIDDYKTYREKDIQKNLDFINDGYIMHRIKLNDWINDPQKVIKDFKKSLIQ